MEAKNTVTCPKSEEQSASGSNMSNINMSSTSPVKSIIKCNCVNSKAEEGCSFDANSVDSNCSSAESSDIVDSDWDAPPLPKRRCCLIQRVGSTFNCSRTCDIVFVVGSEKIKAHKFILSIASPIFNAMFSKKWFSGSREIEISDIEPSVFSTVLRFVYTDEANLTPDTVTAVLYAARKYLLQSLEDSCVNFLIDNLCPENGFTVLNQASLLDIQKLITACLKAIDKDTDAAVTNDAFCDVHPKTMCVFLSRNSLTIREIKLFEALVRWSEAECLRKHLEVNPNNKRQVLKEMLPLLRFPLMSPEEFSCQVASTGLLTDAERLSLYEYFTVNLKPQISFCDAPRSCQEFIVNRFGQVQHGLICPGTGWDSINFICDADVQLLGFGLYSSTSGSATFEGTIGLKTGPSYTYVCSESNVFNSVRASLTYRAMFKKPLKITANQQYTATVNVKGPKCFYGKEGKEKVTTNLSRGRKMTVIFSNYSKPEESQTHVKAGQLPELIFSA